MSSRIACLAFSATLFLVAPVVTRAQAPDIRTSFLTGPCIASSSSMNLDSLVAEPEVRPSLRTMDSLLVPPADVRANDHDMKMVVALVVDTNGSVRPGTVALMSSTDSALSKWACDAVPRMRFNAARDHGRAAATQVLMPFTFRPPANIVPAPVGSRTYLQLEVEKLVKVTRNVFPRYPDDLKKEGVQGDVVVHFVVDTTGRADMSTFRVVRTADLRFVEPVRHAVALMAFQPAEIAGHKVRQAVEWPFSFWLERD